MAEQTCATAALKPGDEHIVADLFGKHRERLWRLINFRLDKRLAGRVDADDVLQESYLAAVQRIGHCAADSDTSRFIWVRLIVLQTLVDVHRRHFSSQRRNAAREVGGLVGGSATPAHSGVLAAQFVASVTSPSRIAARAELIQAVEAAIEQMEPIDREVLAMRHFEEMTNSETAEALGIDEKAASIRYVRAVRRLKTMLSKQPGFSD